MPGRYRDGLYSGVAIKRGSTLSATVIIGNQSHVSDHNSSQELKFLYMWLSNI